MAVIQHGISLKLFLVLLNHCMLSNFYAFCHLLIFLNQNFSKFESDHDLGSNCLQSLSTDETCRQRVNTCLLDITNKH